MFWHQLAHWGLKWEAQGRMPTPALLTQHCQGPGSCQPSGDGMEANSEGRDWQQRTGTGSRGQGLAASMKLFKVGILTVFLVCSSSGVRAINPSWTFPRPRYAENSYFIDIALGTMGPHTGSAPSEECRPSLNSQKEVPSSSLKVPCFLLTSGSGSHFRSLRCGLT